MPVKSKPKCYVYIISDGAASFFGQQHEGFIKVGLSSNPRNRLKDLQCANPRPLEILLVIELNSRFGAEIFEAGLHHRMRFQHAKNEWFHFNKSTEALIKKIKESGTKLVTKDWV